MKRLSFLLLDANVVIQLFQQGLWDAVVTKCDIHLGQTILQEAHFYERHGSRYPIDLRRDADTERIHVFDVTMLDMATFRQHFDASYMERLDPGETESLAYLLHVSDQHLLCSGDSIVYKVLGILDRSDQGISLEEVLDQLGLGRKLPRQFTKSFREQWTHRGFTDGLWGSGKRSSESV